MNQIIFHIDLDAFFASVEEILNPTLKNKPLIVAGRHRKSVVSCANYLARKHGIYSAMPIFKAIEKFPNIKIVNVNMPAYEKYSAEFKNFITNNISFKIEDFSIDECFVDVSNNVSNFDEAIKYAEEVQNLISYKLNLSASIGISDNKFLAKMATDMKKPKGISLLLQKDVKEKIWPLPIEKMLWIGFSSKEKLNKLNIKTIGDLANFKNIDFLKPIFGKKTQEFIQNAWGYGDKVIDSKSFISKSISISKTFFDNSDNTDELINEIINICEELYKKMKIQNMTGTTLTLGLKDNKWNYKTKSKTFEKFILQKEDLIKKSIDLFKQLFNENIIRMISIGVSNLKFVNEIKLPINLFDSNEDISSWSEINNNLELKTKNKNVSIDEIAKNINEKIGKNLLFVAKNLKN
ncbi:Y-family DNA polymerase [Mycoplasmoides pirum]|uniref:Y-family DNA polymerase n=1 Tax=Mycoplasmoides pirum TaxID=2122 RepID=UPI0004802E42|nr:DNA polymerase IV [Mycoplasmoides pirum]